MNKPPFSKGVSCAAYSLKGGRAIFRARSRGRRDDPDTEPPSVSKPNRPLCGSAYSCGVKDENWDTWRPHVSWKPHMSLKPTGFKNPERVLKT